MLTVYTINTVKLCGPIPQLLKPHPQCQSMHLAPNTAAEKEIRIVESFAIHLLVWWTYPSVPEEFRTRSLRATSGVVH